MDGDGGVGFDEIGGDLTFRLSDTSIPVGEEMEPDLRLASITMMGCSRFTEDDAWDITAITAFFGLSNRMANVTSMRPNDEFYAMGR